ncbi:MAG: exodeoxyribonuclease VII large subunit [Mariprofundaceae bacterium]
MISAKPVTVTELTARIKQTLEQGFSRVEVLGEVSRLSKHASGHVYFTIKDANATLAAVIWRSTQLRLSIKPEESRQYIFSGYISLYPPRGSYQLIVTALQSAGEGALAAEFECRKRIFAERGWFNPERKKPLPYYPHRIGIVTSRTAAAFADVKKILAVRPAWLHLLLAPCRVQGNQAIVDIVHSIELLQSLSPAQRPDLLLLVRGGGSIEDLWCFNEEAVVKAIVDCDIPIITGIGHEVDTTLADLAADIQAATPSNAAELVCPDRDTLRHRLPGSGHLHRLAGNVLALASRRHAALEKELVHTWHLSQTQLRMYLEKTSSRGISLLQGACTKQRTILRNLNHRLAGQQPHARMVKRQRLLAASHQHLHDAAFRHLDRLMARTFNEKTSLEALSPYKVLSRGYTLTLDSLGKVVGSVKKLQPGDHVELHFHDGKAEAKVISAAPIKTGESL